MDNWPIKILSVVVAILLFLFHRIGMLEERFFSVPLEVQVNERLIPAESYPNTVRVTLRGRSEEINLALEEDISVYADFTQYTEEGSYTVPIRVRKSGSLNRIEPLELQVEPEKLSLRLERRLSKSVEVEPSIVGYPAQGYELSQYFVSPSTVEVEGVASVVEGLEQVETENIDLSGKREDISLRVRLKQPSPFVSYPGGDTVEFSGIIQEKTVLRSLSNVDLIAIDLQSGLAVEGLPESNRIRIQGTQRTLEQYDDQDYRLTFDCSAIDRPGAYTLEVSPDVPQGILVLSYEPTEIDIRVVEAEAAAEQASAAEQAGAEAGAEGAAGSSGEEEQE
jgi:YbbR domain-containing protein